MKISSLTKCPCGRWLSHMQGHVRCLPPIVTLQEPPKAHAPAVPVVSVDRIRRGAVRLLLGCGHSVERVLSRAGKKSRGKFRYVKCQECAK